MLSRLSAFSVLLLPSLAVAQTPPPKVPPGFKAELILEAPDIEAPTALCVAPNGDVYFGEDPMDMAGPPTKPLDKIWLLKGGDPKKKILVADKMWAVMGLEIVRDKLYVVHPPYVTVFTLDAEGKPTKREELFTDLGPKVAGAPGFNDHVPSGIRMGMDGWLYVSIGDKGIPKMTRKEKDAGSVHVAEGRWKYTTEGHHISLEGGGVIRFRPDGTGLEVFASGTRNHLDVPMDEHDRIFVRDNTNDGGGWNTRLMYLPRGAFMGYPWAFTQHPEETLPAIHDFGGGSPCGGYVYCDDGLPETYRGRIFHCEWGKGKVLAVKVKEKGAGFEFVDEIAFMDPEGTKLKDFRPFSIRPTADGRGFYVTDWAYNGWLAKVKAGRLWKVTYTGDDVRPAPRGTDGDSIEKLVKSLAHPALTERLRAQRELIARGAEVAPACAKVAEQRNGKGYGESTVANHALWVLREVSPETLVRLLNARGTNPPLSYEDCRVAADLPPGQLDDDILIKIVEQRQEQAVWALANQRGPKSVLILVSRLGSEQDVVTRRTVERAVKKWADWDTLPQHLPLQRPAFQEPWALAGLLRILDNEYHTGTLPLLERLAIHRDPAVRKLAVATLARNAKERPAYAGGWWGTRPEQNPPPARTVAWAGTPAIRDALVAALGDADAGVRLAAVNGLSQLRDPETLAPLVARFQAEKDAAARASIAKVVGTLPGNDAIAFLAANASDQNVPLDVRLVANAGLHGRNDPAALDALIAIAGKPIGFRDHAAALAGLAPHRSPKARAVIEKSLTDEPNAQVKVAAIQALAAFGDEAAAKLIAPELDADCKAPKVAAQAIAGLKYRPAIPALVKLSAAPEFRDDAILALTAIPDSRALSAYLTGLQSKNPAMRQACRSAVTAIRDQAAPILEQLAARKELPAEALGELRGIYTALSPVTAWRVAGTFSVNAVLKERNFDAWKPFAANPKTGEVNLAGKFDPDSNVCVFAVATIDSTKDRAATLAVGSDDMLRVWVNGQQVFDFNGNRGWAAEQDKVGITLKAGKNELLIRCGNASGPWAFSAAVTGETKQYAFLEGAPAKLDLAAYRAFAGKNQGDAERGRKLFFDVKGVSCIKCHAVGKEGGTVGPAIDGVGLKYNRDDLMTSILEPSKTIANGYETVVITTNAGKTITGVFKGESGDAVSLADADGKLVAVAKSDIDEKTFTPVSSMPNGLSDGMTLQDFADIVAYLAARREEKPK